jgi:hypothetical protein
MSFQGFSKVVGFAGYLVSQTGNIWSNKYGKWRKLKPGHAYDRFGRLERLIVVLRVEGKSVTRKVHDIVLRAFKGKPKIYLDRGRLRTMECRHLDGNPANNHIDNLIWGTHKENIQDREQHGGTVKGENDSSAKLSNKEVAEMRDKYATGKYSQSSLGLEYHVCQGTVSSIVRRKHRKAG